VFSYNYNNENDTDIYNIDNHWNTKLMVHITEKFLVIMIKY